MNGCDTNVNNTYSSVKEVKLENDDGMGPLKSVPTILLQQLSNLKFNKSNACRYKSII